MAMTRCPECKEDVSDLAASCVKCGRELREPSTLGSVAKGLFLAFNGVMALWLIGEVLMGLPSRVFEPWAIGSVILGMFALVTRGAHFPRRARAPEREHADDRAQGSTKTGEGTDEEHTADDQATDTRTRKDVWRRLRD